MVQIKMDYGGKMESIELKKKKNKKGTSSQREKENRIKKKLLSELAIFYDKAKRLHLDKDVILGSLLDLAENLLTNEVVEKFKEKAKEYQKKISAKNPITISLKNPPSSESKLLLKKMKFKWNSFRKEFYGFGDITNIEKQMAGIECSINVIDGI